METAGRSRLLQMQARFQQKQLQERELKIASLYESQQARALDRVRHSPSNGVVAGKAATPPSQPPVPMNPGKVRQMFEERRTKAGIDKSYPLQPIVNTDRPGPRKAANGLAAKVHNATSSHAKIAERKASNHTTVAKHAVKRTQHKIENIVNGSGDLNHNHKPDMNSVKKPLPRSNGEPIPSAEDELDNNYLIENETFPDALAPLPTPRTPEPKEPKRPARRSPTTRASPVAKAQPVAPPRRVTSDKTVPETRRARGAMHRGVASTRNSPSLTAKIAATSQAEIQEGVPCPICGRRFDTERIAKHETICRRSSNKKRKPFDALKHRLQGTEAEQFIGKIKRQQSGHINKNLNSTWRQKHEDFIQTIRAAKQVQAHIAAGGKASDLPPPPPSENPDYVQCPHCQRRFNQAAAERHIPKCKNYQFNKPNPNTSRRR